jgi:hypothetical protein
MTVPYLRFPLHAALTAALIPCSFAAELILPAAAERTAPVTAIFRTSPQATGVAELKVIWTDVLGRVVEHRTLKLSLVDETEIRFDLDLRRAVATQNTVKVHFHLEGKNRKGEPDRRDEDVSANLVATPGDPTWWDYMTIMWQGNTAASFNAMKSLGVNVGKSPEHSAALPLALLQADLRFYVENIATDFYAAYHRYRADRPYNFDLLRAKELYKSDRSSKQALKREPSLADPAWLNAVRERATKSAQVYAPYRPVFYNLGDESGIAELAGFWDFDFSDYALDGMRGWLKQRYGTLAVLNQQWDAHFQQWQEVVPDTTPEAMKRANENYSSWSDHKEWMDISFASALKTGADAIRAVDPHAYVGIEGAQMPGWGGYDYARLAASLQMMEPYDIGDNIEIIRSLNPQLAFVTTAFAQGAWEKHRIWYELLHGARGHIIWDEKYEVVGKDAVVGLRGKEVAPYWNELHDGIGALLINSERQAGPIAIHYSQASMRSEWMLAQKPKGDAWIERMSWTERKDSDFLRLRESYCRLIEDQGLQYNFVSYSQVEGDELLRRGYRMLILPHSSALSSTEASAITRFVQQGGTLVVDGEAGIFDEHCRRLPQSGLSTILNGAVGRGRIVRMDALRYHQERLVGKETGLRRTMSEALQQAGVRPAYQVLGTDGKSVTGVEVHEFRNGGVTIIGLLSNPQLTVDELGPPEFRSNQRFEKTQELKLIAPTLQNAVNIRAGKALGSVKEISVTLDPYEPRLIAFSSMPLPAVVLHAPERVARGEAGSFGISLTGRSDAKLHIFHVAVRNPGGQLLEHYSGNLRGPNGSADKLLPIALNDQPGQWTMQVTDVLTGAGQTTHFTVD